MGNLSFNFFMSLCWIWTRSVCFLKFAKPSLKWVTHSCFAFSTCFYHHALCRPPLMFYFYSFPLRIFCCVTETLLYFLQYLICGILNEKIWVISCRDASQLEIFHFKSYILMLLTQACAPCTVPHKFDICRAKTTKCSETNVHVWVFCLKFEVVIEHIII